MGNAKMSVTPLLGIFNDCFPPIMDGVSMATQNYAYWLSKKTRNNVCVVTPNCPGSDVDMPYSVYRYSSFFIPFRKPYRFGFPLMDRDFNRQMGELPFGLVHAHCPFSSGKIAMRIAKRRHIPIVATFHSKYKMDFARIVPNKYILNHIVQNIVDFYDMADEVWIPQAAVEETIREYGYKGRVEVVENGNDFVYDAPIEIVRCEARRFLGISEDESVFLFVGQHIWEKNISFLLHALALLKDLRFRMYFVGTGYAENGIKRLTNELDLSSHVTFVGQINDRERLKRYYAAANLFLFPSLYDNAPLVVREAAAMQTPSVMLQDSTASEIIMNGYNGFLCAHRLEDYAGLICRLMLYPEEVRRVGFHASQTIVRSWSDVVDEVLDRYVHLMNRG